MEPGKKRPVLEPSQSLPAAGLVVAADLVGPEIFQQAKSLRPGAGNSTAIFPRKNPAGHLTNKVCFVGRERNYWIGIGTLMIWMNFLGPLRGRSSS